MEKLTNEIMEENHIENQEVDENTAIVVQGDRFEVIGQSYVAIYDYNRLLDSGGLFYLLAPGDRFHLKTREIPDHNRCNHQTS